MNSKIICKACLLLTILLSGCSINNSPEPIQDKVDINFSKEIPILIEYNKTSINDEHFEIKDKDTLVRIVLTLAKIELYEEVTEPTNKHIDKLTLHYDDNSVVKYEFEENNIVVNNKRYRIAGDNQLRQILLELSSK